MAVPLCQSARRRWRTRSTTRSFAGSRGAAAAALATLALVASGCSGSDSSTPSAGSSSTATTAAQPVAAEVSLGKVAGTIKKKNWKAFMDDHRETMLKQVGDAVASWVDGGFVGVDYPTDSFDSAFSSFTPEAKRDATRQQSLMTNWDLRNEIDGVEVQKDTVTVDVMAPKGRPAGATARVRLVFTTTGDTQQRVTVRGRLFLTPGHGEWRIFGYDVSKGAK
jgi:hypothetical protein